MKEIFTRNIDINKTSFLNWRTSKNSDIENILVLAEGYLDSSIELAKFCLKDNRDKKADILIFPILANANHGIELYLKSLVWILNKLLGSKQKIEGNHNIKQILDNLKVKIRKYKGQSTLNSFNKRTANLQNYVTELFTRINATLENDNMDFSRYPLNKNYINHFYVDEFSNVEIDLENLLIRFQEIKECLDEIAYHYFDQELNQEW